MPENPSQNTSFKSLFSVPAFRVYFIFSTITLLFLGALVYWSIPDDKDLKSTLRGKDAEIEDLESSIEFLKWINKIDERLIVSGDYEEAIEEYQALQNKADNEQIIEMLSVRTQHADSLKQYFKKNKGQSQRKDYLISKKEEEITVLTKKTDSLNLESEKMREAYKDTLADLKHTLSRKEEKLNQKEKVKVLQFESSNNQKVHYLGEVENGKANGGGVGIWSTGSLYKGDWKDNRRHGKGTIESQNGERYEGNWIDGKREGEGKYYWPSGEKYEGEWKDNKRHGKGILYDRDNNVQYEGMWKNDKPVK